MTLCHLFHTDGTLFWILLLLALIAGALYVAFWVLVAIYAIIVAIFQDIKDFLKDKFGH